MATRVEIYSSISPELICQAAGNLTGSSLKVTTTEVRELNGGEEKIEQMVSGYDSNQPDTRVTMVFTESMAQKLPLIKTGRRPLFEVRSGLARGMFPYRILICRSELGKNLSERHILEEAQKIRSEIKSDERELVLS